MFDVNRKLKGLLEDQIPRVVEALEYVHTFLAERAEPKWEYVVEEHEDELVQKMLNIKGEQGWELVAAQSVGGQTRLFLRRRLG